MPWLKLDDGFDEHPKLNACRDYDRALSTMVQLMCYAARNLTDGQLPARVVERMDTGTVEELLRVGMIERSESNYLIHDYLDYNPSREKVTAEREAARVRQERARGNGVSHGVTNGVTSPHPVPVPVPNPLDPKSKSVTRTESETPTTLSSFPDCLNAEVAFMRDGKLTDTIRGIGHINRALEAKGYPVSEADRGKLGAAIKATCPDGCNGYNAFDCTRQVCEKVEKAHTLRTAISFVKGDKRC